MIDPLDLYELAQPYWTAIAYYLRELYQARRQAEESRRRGDLELARYHELAVEEFGKCFNLWIPRYTQCWWVLHHLNCPSSIMSRLPCPLEEIRQVDPVELAAACREAAAWLQEHYPGGFVPAPDYSLVYWRGQAYSFTPLQAAIVRLLHQASKDKLPGMQATKLLEASGTDASHRSVRRIFADGRHPAFGTLIRSRRQGRTVVYYLDIVPLPDPPDCRK